MTDIVERLRDEMPSSLNDACRRLEIAADEIERLREQFRQMEINRNYWMDKALREKAAGCDAAQHPAVSGPGFR